MCPSSRVRTGIPWDRKSMAVSSKNCPRTQFTKTIRTVLSKDDGMEMYPETLRTWVDSIALAVATLDQTISG